MFNLKISQNNFEFTAPITSNDILIQKFNEYDSKNLINLIEPLSKQSSFKKKNYIKIKGETLQEITGKANEILFYSNPELIKNYAARLNNIIANPIVTAAVFNKWLKELSFSQLNRIQSEITISHQAEQMLELLKRQLELHLKNGKH